jgi:hypothetical protein
MSEDGDGGLRGPRFRFKPGAILLACYVPRVTDATTLTHLQSEMEQELKRLFGVARAALAAH